MLRRLVQAIFSQAIFAIALGSITIFGGILLGAVALPTPVSALEAGDVVMSINPSNQELDLKPGETYHGTIEVSNVGRLPFKVTATVRPFYVKDDSYDPDFSTETAYTKLHNWIKLSEADFSIQPGAKHVLEFEIDVPSDVASGGQYAAIMFLSESEDNNTAGVNVSGQIASLLYGHVNGGSLRAEGELVDHSLPGFIVDKDFRAAHKSANGDLKASTTGFFVSQTVKNSGNVDFRVTQTMTITNFFTNREVVGPNSVSGDGQIIGTNTSVVLPGTSRTGILTWPDAPKLGLFTVTQAIRFLDQDYTFSQVVFLCPIWLIVVVLALLIVLVIWLIMRLKRKSHHEISPTL